VARFEAERQLLALVDHPNVAQIIDAGTTDTGRPFFVMELVKGMSITTFCDKYRVSLRSRLKFFVDVCGAVQHAHQKGIIHRDIKPSNVLACALGKIGVVKVIDFGVAKAISQELTDRTIYTLQGQQVGTPQYMSPEQAATTGVDVDTRSDVYSLGVLLYELITGTVPLPVEELREGGYLAMEKLIFEKEPQIPSARLRSLGVNLEKLALSRSISPSRLVKRVKGDLDHIVMKALAKNRAFRYQTANALTMDVARYLNSVNVLASPPTLGYHFGRLLQRNRSSLIIAVVAFLTGILVAILCRIIL
jgi:serine/threonine protein kinase